MASLRIPCALTRRSIPRRSTRREGNVQALQGPRAEGYEDESDDLRYTAVIPACACSCIHKRRVSYMRRIWAYSDTLIPCLHRTFQPKNVQETLDPQNPIECWPKRVLLISPLTECSSFVFLYFYQYTEE